MRKDKKVKLGLILSFILLQGGGMGLLGYRGVYLLFFLLSFGALLYGLGLRGLHILFGMISAIFLIGMGLPILNLFFEQSLSSFIQASLSVEVQQAIFLSFYASFLTALLSSFFGIPLGYILARFNFSGKNILEGLVDLPLIIPHSVAGLALLYVYGRGGVIGAALREHLSFFGTLAGVVIAMLFVSFPYAVNSIRESFESINPRIEMAARSLGARPWEVFKRISLPLIKRGVLTGALLSWARSISEFGAVAIIAYNIRFWSPIKGKVVSSQVAPVFIYDQYLQFGLEHSGAAAALLLLASLCIFILFRRVAYRR